MSTDPKVLVVLPTYNEADNIASLLDDLLQQPCRPDICVVDDNSADGTSTVVEQAKLSHPDRIHLIVRSGKDGRGGAVRTGLQYGLKSSAGYDAFVEMDSDFSHPPSSLKEGLGFIKEGFDVALGSRYPDGTIIGWPLPRRIFSRFANRLTRLLISPKIHDYTNGFRFYNRRAVELLLSVRQKNQGFIYLSEMLSIFIQHRYRIGTFPIIFRNRERGTSSMNISEIKNALIGIFRISWDFRRGQR